MQAPRFHSRIDIWLAAIIWVPLVLAFVVVARIPKHDAAWVSAMSVVALGLAFCGWMYADTSYVFASDALVIRSGPFRWRVLFAAMRKVSMSNTVMASPALSIHRLEIEYNKYDVAVISPNDVPAFLEALRERAPAVEMPVMRS